MALESLSTTVDKTPVFQGEKSTLNPASAMLEKNARIIQSASNSTLTSKNQPLKLLYQAAVSSLNEKLKPYFGDNAIQEGLKSGIDVSPQATAERIVSLATGFYSLFAEQHPGENETEVLDKFMQTIGKGIEQGFAEARDILDGLQVLHGDIATNIDSTYDLVQEGLLAFKQNILNPPIAATGT